MITDAELGSLERGVVQALARGDASGLCVLGYGEISLVLGWPVTDPRWACKRLPPFPAAELADAFAATFDRYLELLRQGGVRVLDTEVRRVPVADAPVALYCIQPVLPADTLATNVVRADPRRAESVLAEVVDHILAVTGAHVGIDAQLSNWAVADSGLLYIDVTTPLVRGPDGRNELDTDLFLASLPWILRGVVKRFVIPGVIERYHQPRTVILDLAANLIKEHLAQHIPAVLAAAADRIDPPLLEEEVWADYRSDARTWAAIQAMRRMDRLWQRRVRRRPYPFLLPDRIDR